LPIAEAQIALYMPFSIVTWIGWGAQGAKEGSELKT